MDWIIETYRPALPTVHQLSLGNEGSAFDPVRFHRRSLLHLLERSNECEQLQVLSIETRPEYISADALEFVRRHAIAPMLDVTVGFETVDDALRTEVLGKQISRRVLEERVSMLGDHGASLTSYVMVKPAPGMTESEGVSEAIATIEYLQEICTRRSVRFTAYVVPTYVSEGSQLWARMRDQWIPPTIQSVGEVVQFCMKSNIRVYVGLWTEGLAGPDADFHGRPGYDPSLRELLVRLSRTGDTAAAEPGLRQRLP